MTGKHHYNVAGHPDRTRECFVYLKGSQTAELTHWSPLSRFVLYWCALWCKSVVLCQQLQWRFTSCEQLCSSKMLCTAVTSVWRVKCLYAAVSWIWLPTERQTKSLSYKYSMNNCWSFYRHKHQCTSHQCHVKFTQNVFCSIEHSPNEEIEPTRPQRIISALQTNFLTNFNLSPSYSFH